MRLFNAGTVFSVDVDGEEEVSDVSEDGVLPSEEDDVSVDEVSPCGGDIGSSETFDDVS